MAHTFSRRSWDTAVKHMVRNGVLQDILTSEQMASIPRSNLSRWRGEANDKYTFCQINAIIQKELEFIKRINQSSKIKKINESYFKLVDALHDILSDIKGVKSCLKNQKELIVNTIESVKEYVPMDAALKVFHISRSTFENYKSIVIHKCDRSYFNWCAKRFSNQLLSKEIQVIKNYMINDSYRHWSKASVYLKAVRDQNLHCCLSTFYKYCRLLGFKNKTRKRKSDGYHPIKTIKPNELWCADVTVFKTGDHIKHYIHFLMDHYSKYIIGYRVCTSPSSFAIKELLREATLQHQPNRLQFLTDGGSENVNQVVHHFINRPTIPIEHIIAQKDVAFSNSMVEALNKIIKHQFLFPKVIDNRTQLEKKLAECVPVYNTIRPQMSLGGNTPQETFKGLSIDFSRYSQSFNKQSVYRRVQNKGNDCKKCL